MKYINIYMYGMWETSHQWYALQVVGFVQDGAISSA